MDWYPLFNSLRIAAISTVVIFFSGIAAAYYIAKLPRLAKGALDVVMTLPLVLPPTVLAFARALGEYGATAMIAGYTPGRTATISTTVYQPWRTNNDVLAFRWVLVNLAISAVVLLAVNLLERGQRQTKKGVRGWR